MEKDNEYRVFTTSKKGRYIVTYNSRDFNDVINYALSDRPELLEWPWYKDPLYGVKFYDLILN